MPTFPPEHNRPESPQSHDVDVDVDVDVVRLRRWDLYFAVAFGLALGLNLVVVWATPWLPMGDYGGWLELIDVVARYDDPATLFSNYYSLPTGFEPNSLVVHVGSWLAHLMPTDIVGKVFLSWYVIGLPMGVLMMADAFGRSRWLSFLALPMTFNALFNIGLLNFLVALPLMLMLIAIARNHATQRRISDGILLALLLVVLFYAHVLTFMMTLGMIAPAIIFGIRRPRDLGAFAWLLPSLLPFGIWVFRKYVLAEPTEAGRTLTGPDGLGLVFESLDHRIEQFHAWGMRYFRDGSDDLMFIVLVLTWLGLMTASQQRENPAQSDERSIFDVLRAHTLEIITLGCVVAYFALPSHMREIELIAERVVVPILLFMMLWPRLRLERSRLHLLILPAIIGALVYPWLVHHRFARFNREIVGDLPTLIANLPPRSRLAYLFLDREVPGTYMGPHWHIPKALMAIGNGGMTDDSFAIRPYCPVQFQPGRSPRPISPTFWRGADLSTWDYVLVRAQRLPFVPGDVARLELVHGGGGWFLFKVLPPPPGLVMMAGPSGGEPKVHDCPDGDTLARLAIVIDPQGIESLQPQCSSLGWTAPWLGSGNQRNQRRVNCNEGEVMVGLAGHIGGFVRALAPVCALVDRVFDPEREERVGPMVGPTDTSPFRITCPAGKVVAGFRGRAGARVDAVGIRCIPQSP